MRKEDSFWTSSIGLTIQILTIQIIISLVFVAFLYHDFDKLRNVTDIIPGVPIAFLSGLVVSYIYANKINEVNKEIKLKRTFKYYFVSIFIIFLAEAYRGLNDKDIVVLIMFAIPLAFLAILHLAAIYLSFKIFVKETKRKKK